MRIHVRVPACHLNVCRGLVTSDDSLPAYAS